MSRIRITPRQRSNIIGRLEGILREVYLIEGNEVFDPRTNELFRIDRRSNAYLRRINDIINSYEPPTIQANSIAPDFEIWFPNFIEGLRNNAGNSINISWNGIENINFDVDIPNNPTRAQLLGIIHTDFRFSSDLTIFSKHQFDLGEYPPDVEITIIRDVERRNIQQLFRDGLDHCVFEPIKLWALDMSEKCEKKTQKIKYNTLLKRAKELEKEYEKGVPAEDINKICDYLQIGIDITAPLTNKVFVSHRSNKKPKKVFKFINTRLNHVEIGGIVSENNTIELETYEELLDKKAELDNENEFYVYIKSHKNVSSVITLHNKFVVNNEYNKVKKEFMKTTGLNNCMLDDIDDNNLSFFVWQGTHYNETIDFQELKGLIKHIDQKKAYANFHISKYYNGLLGKITDFRKVDKMIKDKNGYIPALYRIWNLNFDNCKYTKLLQKLGCYKNNNIYPSCELEFLLDIGITFEVFEGCWGVKSIDFRFPEEMLKDDNGVKRYARFVGGCDSHKLTKRIWLKGDYEYFQNLQDDNNRIQYDEELNEGCITFKKEHNFHLGHITAFITSLQRINCIEQLFNFKYENIIRICCDGIYYINDEPELVNLFRVKGEIKLGNKAGDNYCSNMIDCDEKYEEYLPEFKENIKEELHIGAGGTGKTHINLSDEGYCKVLYIAPSYKLASKKREEYNCKSTCWNQLLTDDPTIYGNYLKYYNTLIFDEVSMMNQKDLQTIRKRYNNCKIIMCGDLGFQLPCFSTYKDKQLNIEEKQFKNIVRYEKNYRVKCDRLHTLLLKLREMMDSWGGDQHLKYVLNNYNDRVVNNTNNYDIKDYILTYTNASKDLYTELYKGKFEKEKYYFTERYGEYCNGSIDILPKDYKGGKCDIRHAFTIHSIQGETIPDDKKLFIDITGFNYSIDGKLLYTAISRARRLSQIYFVVK